jgi:hypothetical protein
MEDENEYDDADDDQGGDDSLVSRFLLFVGY